jgi:hypothetical protein
VHTPIEKYNVAAREPKYAVVNGTLVGESRCFIYGTGPCNAAKLPSTSTRLQKRIEKSSLAGNTCIRTAMTPPSTG